MSSRKPRTPTSSKHPPTRIYSPQHQMMIALSRLASYASVAAPSGSQNHQHSTSQPSATASSAATPSPNHSTLTTAPLNVLTPRRPMTGGAGVSRDPKLRSVNAQTATLPALASPAPPRIVTSDLPTSLSTSLLRGDLSVSLASSRRDVRVNTVTDTPLNLTPSLEDKLVMSRMQRRKRISDKATVGSMPYCGSRSPPLGNLKRKEEKYVGINPIILFPSMLRTPAKSPKLQAPTSSAQLAMTDQPHHDPQHQMTPAQARPAFHASVATSSGSPKQGIQPSAAACSPDRSTLSTQHSEPAAAYHTLLPLNLVQTLCQPKKDGAGGLRDLRLRSEDAQAAAPSPLATTRVSTDANSTDDCSIIVTDTSMLPTASEEVQETMTKPQRKRRSSNAATEEAKRSRSPPLDNLNTMCAGASSSQHGSFQSASENFEYVAKNINVFLAIAAVLRNNGEADASLQDFEYVTKNIGVFLALAAILRKHNDAEANRAASGINQVGSSVTTRNLIPANRKKMNKTQKKKEPMKKWTALKNKAAKIKAKLVKTNAEMKEIKLLEKKKKSMQRSEKTKSMIEKDLEIMKR
ncbi:hypothetical protein PYW08_007879 [Mythimna loreyi]|uniref:Uncharacterized protein n=1 Tax=Mythimna loreyi TaxID=667449 RepID=A0ACC2QD39_9NEOP|nr:hypothetical protein PYW08_007879 [Mythimna loreyi]